MYVFLLALVGLLLRKGTDSLLSSIAFFSFQNLEGTEIFLFSSLSVLIFLNTVDHGSASVSDSALS